LTKQFLCIQKPVFQRLDKDLLRNFMLMIFSKKCQIIAAHTNCHAGSSSANISTIVWGESSEWPMLSDNDLGNFCALSAFFKKL